eukprot:2535688-Prymnesium_polylepis.1
MAHTPFPVFSPSRSTRGQGRVGQVFALSRPPRRPVTQKGEARGGRGDTQRTEGRGRVYWSECAVFRLHAISRD